MNPDIDLKSTELWSSPFGRTLILSGTIANTNVPTQFSLDPDSPVFQAAIERVRAGNAQRDIPFDPDKALEGWSGPVGFRRLAGTGVAQPKKCRVCGTGTKLGDKNVVSWQMPGDTENRHAHIECLCLHKDNPPEGLHYHEPARPQMDLTDLVGTFLFNCGVDSAAVQSISRMIRQRLTLASRDDERAHALAMHLQNFGRG